MRSHHPANTPWPPNIAPEGLGHDREMAKIPDSTKASLHQRLTERSRQRWPQLSEIRLRYRAGFAYVEDAFLPTGFMGGPAEDALDTACGLYLADPTAWT